MRALPRYHKCFVCGRNNQAGLNMVFTETQEDVQGIYTALEKHCSYEGILHGGITSALLDECIGWAVGLKEKKMYVTGELNIRFKTPISIGREYIVKGYSSREQGKGKEYRKGYGQIIDDQGIVYAEGKGTFFPIPAELEPGIISILENPDNSGKEVTTEDIWG